MALDQTQLPQQIQETIQNEAKIRDVPFTQDAEFFLGTNGVTVRIKGKTYQGSLDRPLLHQLANRLWPNLSKGADANANYAQCKQRWDAAYRSNAKKLEEELRDALYQEQPILRILPTKNSESIYGVVSEHFVKLDQGFVYEELQRAIQSDARLGKIFSAQQEWGRDDFGRPCLSFHVHSPKKRMEVGLESHFLFGLNNGYSAYQAKAERYVLICTNGLRGREQEMQWKHTRQQPIHAFIWAFVESGFARIADTQQNVEMRRETPLKKDLVNDLLLRLNLAPASKERIKARLREEIAKTGSNEWSLSQSLTWLGTHEKALSKRPSHYLKLAGTFILDRSLETFLQEESGEFQENGFYASPLLPHHRINM